LKAGYPLLFFFLAAFPYLAFSYSADDSLIGKVAALKGKVIAYNNRGKTIQFLKKGDPIAGKLMLVTRDKSGVRIQFKNGEKLILKSNSKVTIKGDLITLRRGLLKYHDPNGHYETFKFKFSKFDTVYVGKSLVMGRTGKKPFITALNETKIRISQNNTSKKVTSDLRVPDISKFLSAARIPKPNLPTSTVSDDSPPTDSTEEVEDIFGDDPGLDSDDEPENFQASGPDESSTSEVEDIFGDGPDSSTTEVKPAPELVLKMDTDGEEELVDLIDINWKIGFYSTFYLSKPPEDSKIDDRFMHLDFKLNFNDKINISDETNFFHSGWVEFSNRKEVRDDNFISITGRETKKPIIMINEFYWLKSMDKFDITLGKKIVRLGKGMLVSPVDRISPSDSIIPGNSERLGAFITSFDYYLGNSKFTFLWVPYLNTSKSPHPQSRWSTRTDGTNFDITSVFPEGLSWKSTRNILKWETTFKGYDIFLAVFNGANPDPVIKNKITTVQNRPEFEIRQEFVPVTNLSGGFSTTFGGLELHGEYLKQNASEGKDDSYSQFMGGFRYSFDEWPRNIGLTQIDVIMEYIKESLDQEISFPFTLFSSIKSRLFRDNLLGTFNFQVSEKLSYNLGFNLDRQNSGTAYLLGMGYRMANSAQMTFRYESYSGETTSLFGLWDHNDNLAFEYTKDF
tara:strand:- start:69471 stop:71510 length:2040 start_codon:yes stop_codon:yes gene_type:complete